MDDKIKIVILGGYGTFGGRLVELLEGEPRLEIVVAGRSLEKARAFCDSRTKAAASLIPAALDREKDFVAQLYLQQAALLVDATGPFQAYGDNRYHVVEACIQHSVNYLDLADGTEFVAGISTFDAAAQMKRVFILSGVSSFPVLTAAVVKHLATGLQRIDSIRGGIAPSPYAGVGMNVLRAIAGYAGREIPVRRGGTTAHAHPITETMRYTVAPPGRLPLRNTLFSLVDVPDLRVLPELWPTVKNVWMGAGPKPEILHRALFLLAWTVRIGIARSLSGLAGLMDFVTRHARWGEDRGGMFIEIEGIDHSGAAVKRSWHLLAEGHDGPMIPSMAAEIIIRRMLDGKAPAPGARTALQDISLKDYNELFKRRAIFTGARDDMPDPQMPLYKRVLGTAWDDLPREIREMHAVFPGGAAAIAEGAGSVQRGKSRLAQLACAVIGFPKASENVAVSVTFTLEDGVETWTRKFGEETFYSRQYAGRGRNDRLVMERFGPLAFAMALVAEDGKLKLELRRWSFLGIPLPMWLCVRSDSYESAKDGRFHFNVVISHPLTGLIVQYKGHLSRKP